MAPEEVEQLITYPIETAMNGLPNVTLIKSTSAFGMAVVYVYFTDDTDIYFARQLVAERLAAATADLPDMQEPPTLGPISTGLGQIFLYYLELEEGADTGGLDELTYLRDVNDWVVKRQLQTVPGVTDILSAGGHVLQYQIQLDPYLLHQYGLAVEDVVTAVQANNRNVGGQYLQLNSEEHLVRGVGFLRNLDDIRGITLKTFDGTPVSIADVAEVEHGKHCAAASSRLNGGKEVVSGIVMKLFGANSSEVIDALYEKVGRFRPGCREGVKLVPYYEQADLVSQLHAHGERGAAAGHGAGAAGAVCFSRLFPCRRHRGAGHAVLRAGGLHRHEPVWHFRQPDVARRHCDRAGHAGGRLDCGDGKHSPVPRAETRHQGAIGFS